MNNELLNAMVPPLPGTEPVNNAVDANMFANETVNESQLQEWGRKSDPEYAFIQKHIHPPSAIPSYDGMPTNDCRTQVTTNWVNFGVINNSSVISGGSLTPVDTQSITGFAFLTTTGVRHSTICFVRQTSTGADGWRQDLANTQALQVYNTDRFALDANLFRPTYKSLTTYLNATMFNDVGVVASAQFNPALEFAGTLYSMSVEKPDKFEGICRYHAKTSGVVPDLSAFPNATELTVRLSERLRLAARRVPTDGGDFVHVHTPAKPVKLDPNTSIQLVMFGEQGNSLAGSLGTTGEIVPTTTELMNMSTRSYGGKALEGTFSVNRLNTVSPSWKAIGPHRATGTPTRLLGLYQCWASWTSESGVDAFEPFLDHLGGAPMPDVQWSGDMTWTWTVYDGIAPNPNVALTAQPRILAYKEYMGLEIQPTAVSPWAGMQRLSPRPNLAAMQALMLGFYDMKDATQARFNFLAAVGRVLGKVAVPAVKAIAGDILSPKKAKKQAKPRARSASRGRTPQPRQPSRARSNSRRRRANTPRPQRRNRRNNGPRVYNNSKMQNTPQHTEAELRDIIRKVNALNAKVDNMQ